MWEEGYYSYYLHCLIQGEYYLLGDLMVMLRAMCAYECSIDKEMFCQQHGLRVKGINEVRKLRQQLTNISKHY